MSTEQRETLDAILRQSAFPVDSDVDEQRRLLKELLSAQPLPADVTCPVTVIELTGEERDRIYDEQARRYPGFADYARQTAGTRTIPVLALRRSWQPLVGGGGFEPP